MTKRIMLGVAAVALSLAAAAPAHAQTHVGISAGASFPTGDFGNSFNSGYNINGIIGVSMPMSPIGFRGEVGWNQFDLKGGASGDKSRIFNGSANVVLTPSTMMPAKPYLIAGLGAYNVKFEGTNLLGGTTSSSDTRLGFNGGVGLKFGLGDLATFLEARYVSINGKNGGSALNYIPVTFGITF